MPQRDNRSERTQGARSIPADDTVHLPAAEPTEAAPFEKVSRSKWHCQNEIRALGAFGDEERVVNLIGQRLKENILLLEQIRGASLHDVSIYEGRFNPQRANEIIAECADILVAVHERGWVHNDISLGNFILTEQPAAHPVRLIDFETAYRLDAIPPRYHKAYDGTPLFVAPEKINLKPELGQPSDIFALGVCWYALLEDAFPFDPTFGSLEKQILRDNPLPPRNADSDAVRELLMRCLAKDPADRPTAMEIVALLRG